MSKKWPFPNNSNNQQNELVIDYFIDNNNQNHVQPYPQPVADFPIGTFSIDDEFSGMKVGGNGVENGSNSAYDVNNQSARETGIIEKLLVRIVFFFVHIKTVTLRNINPLKSYSTVITLEQNKISPKT